MFDEIIYFSTLNSHVAATFSIIRCINNFSFINDTNSLFFLSRARMEEIAQSMETTTGVLAHPPTMENTVNITKASAAHCKKIRRVC